MKNLAAAVLFAVSVTPASSAQNDPFTVQPVQAQVIRVGDLNTRQVRALDRNKTVVFLQGGMLEEHGPYLPAFTDGILSERLTLETARGVVAKKPEWTALLFPPVSVGASGHNEIGRQFVFPGTYAVRPSTLKAMYMDLATELGEQGFKWIMVAHVHGSPLHIAALDEADYFRDETSNLHPRVTGDVAVVTGRLQRTRNVSGRILSEDWQFRKVYRRDTSGWRVISYHAWETPQ